MAYGVPVMRTPDGVWTVEVITTRTGQCFRVRRRAVIGVHGGAGWAPVGQIRLTLAEVQDMLGPKAFEELAEV